jgi:hypothetical protein
VTFSTHHHDASTAVFFFNIQEKDRCSAKKNTNIQRGEVVLRHFDQIVAMMALEPLMNE